MAKPRFWHLQSYILQWKNTIPDCVLDGRIFEFFSFKYLAIFLTKIYLPVSSLSAGGFD